MVKGELHRLDIIGYRAHRALSIVEGLGVLAFHPPLASFAHLCGGMEHAELNSLLSLTLTGRI